MEFSTTRELLDYTRSQLSFLSEQERDSTAFLIVEELTGLDQNKILLNVSPQLSNDKTAVVNDYIAALKMNKPIQYILGKAHFFGHEFLVDSSTLIPRMETEELVQLVIEKAQKFPTPKILDIGTGTGCIAISIANEVPNAKVSGIDISQDAVVMAKKNAALLKSDVAFKVADIFNYTVSDQYDIIVSNPPYVCEREKALMNENVLAYEPQQALFVPDDDPLLYYNTIVTFCREALKKDGWVCFEINENFGQESADLLSTMGFVEVATIKDINNKDRFVVGRKKL